MHRSEVLNLFPFPLVSEEILHTRKALWFSPSGSQLLYAQFNDSLVDEVPITRYGMDAHYPSLTMVRYPKVRWLYGQISLGEMAVWSDIHR